MSGESLSGARPRLFDSAAHSGPSGRTEGQSILVVEDEWIVARGVQKSLESAGYRVTRLAASAIEALESVSRDPPALALIDVRLAGDVDGIELAAELRRRGEVPVVFLTAYSDAATLDRAQAVLPAGYVVKPFTEAQLLSAVAMAMVSDPGARSSADGQRASSVDGDGQDRMLPEVLGLERGLQLARSLSEGRPLRSRDGEPDLSRLSKREREVLRHLLANERVPQIADALFISAHTVRNHLKSIFRKLGVGSQGELIRRLTR